MLIGYPWGYAAVAAVFAVAIAVASLLQRTVVVPEAAASRIGALDGLRGIAALAVFCHHFLIAVIHLDTGSWAVPPDTVFANLGPVAVTVFFFITALLFYRRAPRVSSLRDWRTLYVSRLFRLAPLYLLVTALVIVIVFALDGFALKGRTGDNLQALAAWLAFGLFGNANFNGNPQTYIVVAGVTWTLRYEWAFYLALPLLAAGVRWLTSPLLRIGIIGVCYATASCLPPESWFGFSTRIAATFLLGFLAVELMASERWRRLLSRTWVAGLGVAALACAVLAPFEAYHPIQQLAIWLFFLPAVCGNGYFGILQSRAIRLLGTISYSTYLLHGILLFVTLRVLSALGWLPDGDIVWILLPLLAVPLIAVSALAFRFVEMPGIDLGRRLNAAGARSTGPAESEVSQLS